MKTKAHPAMFALVAAQGLLLVGNSYLSGACLRSEAWYLRLTGVWLLGVEVSILLFLCMAVQYIINPTSLDKWIERSSIGDAEGHNTVDQVFKDYDERSFL